MQIACKVTQDGKDLIWVEVLVDDLEKWQIKKIHNKVENLARYIADLKGLEVESKNAETA